MLPDAMPGSLAGDPVVGAEHRSQRQRGVTELHGHLDVLNQIQAQPAPLLRNRVAEQTHLRGLLSQIVRNRIVVHDLQFTRNHT
jgi:hypothetical protein